MVWVAWNTLLLTKFLGLSGKLSPEFAAWSPALLFAVIGFVLLSRMEKM
jgi:lipopolysaccharide export LptBFGC system permease protein LptF